MSDPRELLDDLLSETAGQTQEQRHLRLCHGGVIGRDDLGRTIPCVVCRPSLTKFVNDRYGGNW